MKLTIIFASSDSIELFEDGEFVPTKVAEKARGPRVDEYNKNWYEGVKKAIKAFGLSDYMMSYLLWLTLHTNMDNMADARRSAYSSLRRQKTTFLTEKEIDHILHILF